MHRICAEVKERVALGESLRRVFGEILRREERRKTGRRLRLSISGLYRSYGAWEKNPSPLAFTLQYRSGRQCPAPLLREYVRRCLRPSTRSTAEIYVSFVRDWKASKPIPGLGTWRTWARKNRVETGTVTTAFPFSRQTFIRRFSQRDLETYRKLRQAGEKSLASLAAEHERVAREIAAFETSALERINQEET